MKRISIALMGLFLAALPGCGPAFIPRPIVLQDAQFNATLPCVPEADSDGGTVDKTEFGVLRAQTYGCRDESRNVGYVATLGAFEAPSSEPVGADEKTRRNTAIAKEFARQLCGALREKDSAVSCSPGVARPAGDETVLDIEMVMRGHPLWARVRVSYPYIGGMMMVGNVSSDDIEKALDIQLPKP